MTAKKQYSELQPQDGDEIVHCGHLDATPFHFWLAEKSVVQRPDGSFLRPKWWVCCDQCYQQANGDPWKVAMDYGLATSPWLSSLTNLKPTTWAKVLAAPTGHSNHPFRSMCRRRSRRVARADHH